MPERIQRRRTRGWRMPENTVAVTRPSRWGNPWPVLKVRSQLALAYDWAQLAQSSPLYVLWMHRSLLTDTSAAAIASVALFRQAAERLRSETPDSFEEWIAPLRGKNLACWCPIGDPCHGDVLLELAKSGQ